MSLSFLLDAVTASTQLSEAAISAAQDTAVASTISAIHSNTALAAAKLAIELGKKIEMKILRQLLLLMFQPLLPQRKAR